MSSLKLGRWDEKDRELKYGRWDFDQNRMIFLTPQRNLLVKMGKK